jgi:MFS transporter, AAHS family, 3-hydroxyphenylpropionic acid transporter
MAIALERSLRTRGASATVPICFLISCLEGFDLQSAGIAAPKVAVELAMDARSLGLFFATATLGIMIGAYLGGRFSDWLGRKPVLLGSVAIIGLASLACGLAHRVDILLFARLVIGLGLGAALPNLIAIVAALAAPERRNRSVTIIHSGLPFGLASAGLVAWLLPAEAWRAVFVIGGVAPLAILPLIGICLSEPAPPAAAAPKAAAVAALFGDGRAALTLMLWVAFICVLLISAIMVYWLPSLLISAGLSGRQAFAIQIGYGLAGAFGSLFTGSLMDRFSRRRVVLGVFGAMAASLLLMSAASSVFAAVIVVAALVGVLSSAAQASLYALAPAVYPTRYKGAGVGASVGVSRVGTILGPLFAGFLIGQGHSASLVFASLAPISVVAGLLAMSVSSQLGRAETETGSAFASPDPVGGPRLITDPSGSPGSS